MLLKHGLEQDLSINAAMCEDRHRRVIILAAFSGFEKVLRCVLRSKYQTYAEALLWTYGEAVELISRIALECGDDVMLKLVDHF